MKWAKPQHVQYQSEPNCLRQGGCCWLVDVRIKAAMHRARGETGGGCLATNGGGVIAGEWAPSKFHLYLDGDMDSQSSKEGENHRCGGKEGGGTNVG